MFMQLVVVLSLTGSILFLLYLILVGLLNKHLKMTWCYHSLLLLSLFWILPIWLLLPGWSPSISMAMPANISNLSVEMEKGAVSVENATTLQTFDYNWLGYLYGLIVFILLVRFIRQYIQQYRLLMKYSWLCLDPERQALLDELCVQYKVKHAVQLRNSNAIGTPMLAGLFRYTIILPNYSFQHEQLQVVLQHELTHLQRYDNWFKIYQELLKCLHWFNPCIYFLQRVLDSFCELSCDEKVVCGLNLHQRKNYSLLILDLLQQEHFSAGVSGSGFSEKTTLLKRRLLRIITEKNYSRTINFIFLLSVCLLCLAGCGVASSVDEKLPEVQQVETGVQETEPSEQKTIEIFSWEKGIEDDFTTLYINGKEYAYQIAESGKDENMVIRGKDMFHYAEALSKLPAEQLPEDLKLVLDNMHIIAPIDTEQPTRSLNLRGYKELKPGEYLECPVQTTFYNGYDVTVQVNCPYGDAAKLNLYYSGMIGQMTTEVGDFTTPQERGKGELTAKIPMGHWYFTVYNDGSHTILVDSVTIQY